MFNKMAFHLNPPENIQKFSFLINNELQLYTKPCYFTSGLKTSRPTMSHSCAQGKKIGNLKQKKFRAIVSGYAVTNNSKSLRECSVSEFYLANCFISCECIFQYLGFGFGDSACSIFQNVMCGEEVRK